MLDPSFTQGEDETSGRFSHEPRCPGEGPPERGSSLSGLPPTNSLPGGMLRRHHNPAGSQLTKVEFWTTFPPVFGMSPRAVSCAGQSPPTVVAVRSPAWVMDDRCMTALPQHTSLHSPPHAPLLSGTQFEQLREAQEILKSAAGAILRVTSLLDARFCNAVELLAQCTGSVVVCGMGKAGLVGRKLAATLSSTGTRAQFLHPAEAVHGDLGSLRQGDVLLLLSNSGETEEICRLIPMVQRLEVAMVAITSRSCSTLGTQSDVVLETGPIREAGHFGLAPTTSTTVMLALGDALALVVSRCRGFSREQFALLHPAGALGRRLTCVRDVMRSGEQLRIAPQETSIRRALVELRRTGRRTGAVMAVDSEGCLRGLFTDSDLVRLLEQRRDFDLDRPLAEVMTRNPKTLSALAPLSEACELLARHHISEVPVLDECARPIGLVDITDVLALMPLEWNERQAGSVSPASGASPAPFAS